MAKNTSIYGYSIFMENDGLYIIRYGVLDLPRIRAISIFGTKSGPKKCQNDKIITFYYHDWIQRT